VTDPVNPFHKYGTELLSKEIGSNHEQIGFPAEAQAGKDPHCNNKGNGYMNSQEPLRGEALYIGSPIPEWYIQRKNTDAYDD